MEGKVKADMRGTSRISVVGGRKRVSGKQRQIYMGRLTDEALWR